MALDSLTRDELHKLLAVTRQQSRRDWLIMVVKYWHGLRISEILKLTPEWVQDGYLTVQRLKGSLKTTQQLVSSDDPLLDEASALPSYLANIPASTRAFPISRQYFWKVFGVYAALVDIPAHKRHPHVLKHSIAAHSIKTAGIENVRQRLGHKSIASTGEYLRVSDDQAADAVVNAVLQRETPMPSQPVDKRDRYSAAAKKAWETRRARSSDFVPWH